MFFVFYVLAEELRCNAKHPEMCFMSHKNLMRRKKPLDNLNKCVTDDKKINMFLLNMDALHEEEICNDIFNMYNYCILLWA